MKRIVILVLATLGLTLSAGVAQADWGTCCYGGYQPKWMFWTRHHGRHCPSDEERWQKFWHDYYDALQHYYDRLDNIDWVIYYKMHGYSVNGGGMNGCGHCCKPDRQYAPVFVSPTIQWAVPQCSSPSQCLPGQGMPQQVAPASYQR